MPRIDPSKVPLDSGTRYPPPDRDAVLLTIGSRDDRDHGEYSDIDMKFLPGRYSGGGGYARRDGTPYASE